MGRHGGHDYRHRRARARAGPGRVGRRAADPWCGARGGTPVQSRGRSAGGARSRDALARVLDAEVCRRRVGGRQDDDGRRPAARSDWGAAGDVPLSRSQPPAAHHLQVRPRQGPRRQLQLPGDCPAQAWRHPRPGERRRRPHAADHHRAVRAAEGLQPADVRGREDRAARAAACRRRDRRCRADPLDPARHGRPGPADRLRQRRQPVPGPRRGTAAGAGDSRRARRRLEAHRLGAAVGVADARGPRRGRRPGPRGGGAARAPGDRPDRIAAPRRYRDRADRAGVHGRDLDPVRRVLRRDPGPQVRTPAARGRAEGGWTAVERRPSATSRPEHAGDCRGRARGDPARRLRPHDPHVPGDAAGRSRLHQPAGGPDPAHRHPVLD